MEGPQNIQETLHNLKYFCINCVRLFTINFFRIGSVHSTVLLYVYVFFFFFVITPKMKFRSRKLVNNNNKRSIPSLNNQWTSKRYAMVFCIIFHSIFGIRTNYATFIKYTYFMNKNIFLYMQYLCLIPV